MEQGPKLGPTGLRVAENVRTLRGHVSVRELSERLTMVGRPIVASSVTKIELGSRRVDADDLVALSIVLDVTPNRLLLTKDAEPTEPVELFPGGHIDRRSAWQWASGDGWWGVEFPTQPIPQTVPERRERIQRFGDVNRPHDPIDLMPLEDMAPHLDKLRDLARIIGELEAEGVSRKAAMNFVRWGRLVNEGEV